MKESVIQGNIIKAIRAKGGYTVKVIKASKNGVPDILACYKGVFIGIEVKGPNGGASALQIANIQEIISVGGKAIVAKTVKEVIILLEEIDHEKV